MQGCEETQSVRWPVLVSLHVKSLVSSFSPPAHPPLGFSLADVSQATAWRFSTAAAAAERGNCLPVHTAPQDEWKWIHEVQRHAFKDESANQPNKLRVFHEQTGREANSGEIVQLDLKNEGKVWRRKKIWRWSWQCSTAMQQHKDQGGLTERFTSLLHHFELDFQCWQSTDGRIQKAEPCQVLSAFMFVTRRSAICDKTKRKLRKCCTIHSWPTAVVQWDPKVISQCTLEPNSCHYKDILLTQWQSWVYNRPGREAWKWKSLSSCGQQVKLSDDEDEGYISGILSPQLIRMLLLQNRIKFICFPHSCPT